MSEIKNKIINELKQKFNRYPIWIWYDPRKKYEGIIAEIQAILKEDDVNVLTYEGSYLELKYEMWKKDPSYTKKWLLYIRENREQAQWLKDIHRLGKEYRPGIQLKEDPAAKYLIERTDRIPDELAKEWRTDEETLTKAFFCVLFKKDRFNPRDFIIEYLSKSAGPQTVIQSYQQEKAWLSLLEEEYGIEAGLDTYELGKQIIFSELHENSPINKYEKIATDKPKKVSQLCHYWQKHDKDTYIQYIYNLREEYPDIKDAVIESNSLAWNSSAFKQIDEGILDLCIEKILESNKSEIKETCLEIVPIIEKRKEKFWYNNGYAEFWDVIHHGLKTIIKSIEALEKINEENTVEQIISFYEQKGWKIDKEYRKYIDAKISLLQTYEKLEKVREKISHIYTKFLKDINRIFTRKIIDGKRIGQNQIDFWNNFTPENSTAVIVCDALRYELSKELYNRIQNADDIKAEMENKILHGTIPTITETGMTSHLGGLLEYEFENKLRIKIDEREIKNKEDREKILEERGVTVEDLSEFLTKSISDLKTTGTPPRFIFSQFIDKMGETLDNDEQVLSQISKHVDDVEKVILRLSYLGYTKFYITADHGFIYTDRISEELKVSSPRNNEIVKRRFAISRSQMEEKDTYFIVGKEFFNNKNININDLYFAFPRGAACFKARGGNMRYLHGGLSLQELAVPCLKIESKRREDRAKKIPLKIDFPSKITNSIITINISPKGQTAIAGGRNIKLQARVDDKIVSEVKKVEARGKEKINLALKTGSLADVASVLMEAIDSDTQEILKSERVQVDLIIQDDMGFDIG